MSSWGYLYGNIYNLKKKLKILMGSSWGYSMGASWEMYLIGCSEHITDSRVSSASIGIEATRKADQPPDTIFFTTVAKTKKTADDWWILWVLPSSNFGMSGFQRQKNGFDHSKTAWASWHIKI